MSKQDLFEGSDGMRQMLNLVEAIDDDQDWDKEVEKFHHDMERLISGLPDSTRAKLNKALIGFDDKPDSEVNKAFGIIHSLYNEKVRPISVREFLDLWNELDPFDIDALDIDPDSVEENKINENTSRANPDVLAAYEKLNDALVELENAIDEDDPSSEDIGRGLVNISVGLDTISDAIYGPDISEQ